MVVSASCTVVGDEGDGLVFSAIHARGESRTYAKGIVGGTSEMTLSPEEQQALSAARAEERGDRGTETVWAQPFWVTRTTSARCSTRALIPRAGPMVSPSTCTSWDRSARTATSAAV